MDLIQNPRTCTHSNTRVLDLLGHFLKESKHGGKAKKSLDLVHEHLESDTPSSLSNCHQQSKQSAHC